MILVEAGPDGLRDVQAEHPRVHEARRSRSGRSRSSLGESGRVGRADARHARSRGRCSRRTRSSGARACRATSSSRALGLELERGNRIAVGPDLTVAGHPEVYAVGDVAAITDAKTEQVLPQLGSVALQAGEHAGENIARRVAGKETKPFEYQRQGDDGDDRPRRRGRADPRRAHDEGQRPQSLAWGAVHLALLLDRTRTARRRSSTGPGAGFTHHAAAVSRITDDDADEDVDATEEDEMTTRNAAAATATQAGRRVRRLRDHRRPREGDDVPVAVPARAARAARLPDRRRRGRRLDGRPARGARARVDRRHRRAARRGRVRPASPRASRTSPATSATPRPTSASRRRSRARQQPVFYLEIPPFLFGTVVKGLAEAGLTANARVVVEKPFGHDLGVGPRARRRAAPVHRRVAAVPDRPLPREDGPRGDPLPPVRERDARAGLEPELPVRASRSRWPRTSASRTAATSTTRSARCATSSSTT